ncbi:protein OSCP1a [Genypterus blacodes]|uniref:protein OSCP1a n=1 Tax=Genypterus blacodes TaxID=154954 RepID=UPI003F768745
MSMRTLPLLFINLGGEMIYILDQRLQATISAEQKSDTVLNDIIGAIFSKAFMDELLKPQLLYSHNTLKVVLTRLAHASIMRLNSASMDRLYELMIMAFKYQIFLCPRPKDLLLITYNHIDAIRHFVKDIPVISNQVDEAHRKIIEAYSSLSEGEFQLLRQTLLIFFQDTHVRVSLLLNIKVQKPCGRFALSTLGPVPRGVDVPGLIRMFDIKGREVKRCEFPTGGSYTSAIREGCFDLNGDRVIRLGLNMCVCKTITTFMHSHHVNTSSILQRDDTPNPLAKEELNLLARLMGSVQGNDNKLNAEPGFRINLFTTDQQEEEAGDSGGPGTSSVINIQAMQDVQASTELARIAGEFANHEEHAENPSNNKGEDLLAMMDDL